MTRGEAPGHVLTEAFPRLRWRLRAGSFGPVRELAAFVQVVLTYRRLRPDLVHHVALKPVIYGGIAARLLGVPAMNTVTGLGFSFHARRWYSPLLRGAVLALLRAALGGRRTATLFQNPDDREALVTAGVASRERTLVVRGSGVDLARFVPAPEPAGEALVVLASRMLREKGVWEFCRAAALVQARGIRARFALVGAREEGNRGSPDEARLARWATEGGVERWGHRTDVPAIFRAAAVVCLPSYGEGIPRSLVEACAAGRAVVATDVPGCREVVRDGVNGLLVPVRDPGALAAAIERLLADPGERARMGAAGRRLAERRFGRDAIVARTLTAYCRFFPSLRALGPQEGHHRRQEG